MHYKFKKIRSRFFLQVGLFLLYVAALSGILLLTLSLLKPYTSLNNQLHSLHTNLVTTYSDHADFRLTVEKDNQFFYEGTNEYIDQFNLHLKAIYDTLSEMYAMKHIDKMLAKTSLRDKQASAPYTWA